MGSPVPSESTLPNVSPRQRAICDELAEVGAKANALRDPVADGRCHPSYFAEKIATLRSHLNHAERLASGADTGPDGDLA